MIFKQTKLRNQFICQFTARSIYMTITIQTEFTKKTFWTFNFLMKYEPFILKQRILMFTKLCLVLFTS